MTKYVVFKQPIHLLNALYYTTPRGRFPDTVIETPEQDYAISALHLGPHIQHLIKQYGWQATLLATQPEGKTIFLWQLLGGMWSYADPYCHSHARQSNSVRYEPYNTATQYLLAAKDVEHAQAILDALTIALTPDIKALTILLEDTVNQSPYQFFWWVQLEWPNLNIFEISERTWWGIVQEPALEELNVEESPGRELQIFEEWPYHLEIPPEILHKINWGLGAHTILLSQGTPQTLILRRVDNHPPFIPLADMISLTVDKCTTHQAKTTPPRHRSFQVQLKLIPESHHQILKNRINQLNAEIKAKQAVLNHLQQRVFQQTATPANREPLFLFYTQEDEIPFELRRLLIEWSDQGEELRQLCYARFDDLPHGENVHALTTKRALGQSNTPSLGARLHDYRPQEGAYYDLMPEWADYDLLLFVPHNQQLTLYPPLKPDTASANRLAEAISPNAARQEWLALFQCSGKKMDATRLRRANFRPLLDALQWKLELDIALPVSAYVEQSRQQIIEHIAFSTQRDLASSVEREADKRLSSWENDLKKELDALSAEIARRSKEVERLTQRSDNHVKLADEIKKLDLLATDLSGEFVTKLDLIEVIVNNAVETIRQIRAMEKELELRKSDSGKIANALIRHLEKFR